MISATLVQLSRLQVIPAFDSQRQTANAKMCAREQGAAQITVYAYRFAKIFSMPDAGQIKRETLEADVLIIGAGPAGLACALRLSQLIQQHTQAGRTPALSTENIYVVEK